MKYLIWFLIGLAVVSWIKRLKSGHSNSQGTPRNSSENRPETMRQCARCGTYIPVSEAVTDGSGAIFCCEEHRLQHMAR